ncbi:hypothetical protein GOBAR_DD31490 [Gossypium barbadense]|nr:hypothetical protein GOBAR_DD31490 [Gossypium barbadense]
MLVQDPLKNNEVDEILNQARQLGARPQTVIHNIVLWTNGFTVNDVPLRMLDDPENAHFLENTFSCCVNNFVKSFDAEHQKVRGVLKNLRVLIKGPVHVNLIKRNEKYPVSLCFQHCVEFRKGSKRLSSDMNQRSTRQNFRVLEQVTSNNTSATPEQTSSTSPLNTAPSPSPGLVVEESLPSTSIWLRLADGTRMVAHFNSHNTIGDIRSFIDAFRPESATIYQLQMMEFPPKLLVDPTQTVEQAGLINSVVIQKF